MGHHATTDCRSVTIGIQLGIDMMVMVVLFEVRVVAMHFRLHAVTVG